MSESSPPLSSDDHRAIYSKIDAVDEKIDAIRVSLARLEERNKHIPDRVWHVEKEVSRVKGAAALFAFLLTLTAAVVSAFA